MDALTLQDLLAMKILGDAKVLAGVERLDQRRVDWVSVIEIPVEDFVRHDELVLTTAIGCGDDPEALASFVAEVFNAGAAGLAIAVGKYIESIPENVVAFAELHQFPLMTIPWNVRFADVSRRVSSEIALRTAETGTHGFLRPLLWHIAQDTGFDDFLATLGRGLNAEVAFFDAPNGTWWGSPAVANWCHAESRRISSHLIIPPEAVAKPCRLRIGEVENWPVRFLPICSGARWLGTLVMRADPLRSEMIENHHEMLVHVMALAYLDQESRMKESMQRYEDLVWKLAKGKFKTWDEMIAEASQSGLEGDVIQSYVAVTGVLDNWDSLYHYSQTAFQQQPRVRWERDIVETVRRALAKAGDNLGFRVASTFQRGEWIVFAFTPRRLQSGTFNEVLHAASQALSIQAPHGQLSWGVALGVPGVDGFHQSYQNAHVALEMGRRQKGPGGVYEYERFGHERVLARFLEDEAVRSAIEATVGSLVEYDRQHGADLIHTLSAYLRNRTNVSVTARALHLHRQSLLYRLRKIEMLTGRSLDNADDLFLLEVCVRMLGLRDPHGGVMVEE